MKNKPPTLPAYRTSDGLLLVWCAHCIRWHQHGGCDGTCTSRRRSRGAAVYQGEPCHCQPGTGDGHRVAHCADRSSPYADSGYYLKETGAAIPNPRGLHAKS
jgi:hypothetical protein